MITITTSVSLRYWTFLGILCAAPSWAQSVDPLVALRASTDLKAASIHIRTMAVAVGQFHGTYDYTSFRDYLTTEYSLYSVDVMDHGGDTKYMEAGRYLCTNAKPPRSAPEYLPKTEPTAGLSESANAREHALFTVVRLAETPNKPAVALTGSFEAKDLPNLPHCPAGDPTISYGDLENSYRPAGGTLRLGVLNDRADAYNAWILPFEFVRHVARDYSLSISGDAVNLDLRDHASLNGQIADLRFSGYRKWWLGNSISTDMPMLAVGLGLKVPTGGALGGDYYSYIGDARLRWVHSDSWWFQLRSQLVFNNSSERNVSKLQAGVDARAVFRPRNLSHTNVRFDVLRSESSSGTNFTDVAFSLDQQLSLRTDLSASVAVGATPGARHHLLQLIGTWYLD